MRPTLSCPVAGVSEVGSGLLRGMCHSLAILCPLYQWSLRLGSGLGSELELAIGMATTQQRQSDHEFDTNGCCQDGPEGRLVRAETPLRDRETYMACCA